MNNRAITLTNAAIQQSDYLKTKLAQVIIITSFLFITSLRAYSISIPHHPHHVVIGYIAGYNGIIDVSKINAQEVTHLNYAFANIENNKICLSDNITDLSNLKNLTTLKIKNPDLKLLVSVGGWTWSNNFSDMSLSDSSREEFARSASAFIEKYNLDGLDIDWEYPGLTGAGNINRQEDKENFTLLLKACRDEFNKLEQKSNKKILLTIAAGCSQTCLDHTEMSKLQSYVDYINLMAYDFLNNPPENTFHQAALFPSGQFPNNSTVEQSVNEYLKAGVHSNKIVLGIPFYGHMYKLQGDAKSAAGAQLNDNLGEKGFTFIKDSLENTGKLQYYRDPIAKAVYLYNRTNEQFVTFDDQWSVRQKCKYLQKEDLAGVMFWEYGNDEKAYLLNEINRDLR